jgi:hypothetical protein
VVSEDANVCRIRIDLKEPGYSAMSIVRFIAPSLDQAKELADQEVLKHGYAKAGNRSKKC